MGPELPQGYSSRSIVTVMVSVECIVNPMKTRPVREGPAVQEFQRSFSENIVSAPVAGSQAAGEG